MKFKRLRKMFKNNKVARFFYDKYKARKIDKENKIKFDTEYTFINRSQNKEKLCYVLAGYKQNIWDNIFTRLKEFVPNDVDVCLLSSGKYVEELDKIAQENSWSYLYTKINNVCLSQNVLLREFKNAKYIYKLDEDIFITKDYFTNLFDCYQKLKESGEYNPGVVAPIIPINGFSYMEVLKEFNLEKVYENKFEKPIYFTGDTRMIENSPDVAKFMWGEGGYLPSIDKISAKFANKKFDYMACPIRFSIGAILFEKKLWEDMSYFDVNDRSVVDLGVDEVKLCQYCLTSSRPLVVSKNVAVGHLSFGKQNKAMEEYYQTHKNVFQINRS